MKSALNFLNGGKLFITDSFFTRGAVIFEILVVAAQELIALRIWSRLKPLGVGRLLCDRVLKFGDPTSLQICL